MWTSAALGAFPSHRHGPGWRAGGQPWGLVSLCHGGRWNLHLCLLSLTGAGPGFIPWLLCLAEGPSLMSSITGVFQAADEMATFLLSSVHSEGAGVGLHRHFQLPQVCDLTQAHRGVCEQVFACGHGCLLLRGRWCRGYRVDTGALAWFEYGFLH